MARSLSPFFAVGDTPIELDGHPHGDVERDQGQYDISAVVKFHVSPLSASAHLTDPFTVKDAQERWM